MGDSFRFAYRHRRARFSRRALATVLSQERNKVVHRFKARRIDHGAAVAANRDQPGVAETIEVESQCVWSEVQRFSHASGWHSLRSRLHQQAENIQTVILSQGSQSRHGAIFFHISIDIEIWPSGQEIFRYLLK
jgi:hypothetical protein